jgi:hypothetical protein
VVDPARARCSLGYDTHTPFKEGLAIEAAATVAGVAA